MTAFINKPDFLSTLPDKPGVYKHIGEGGVLLYVGKAKSIKKRVSSYFYNQKQNGKTRMLVSRIIDVQYIVVEDDFEALLLENSLIKKYKPKYNIQLKDDKTYPWIKITDERFPRVFSTRSITKQDGKYFGPYASVKLMNTLLDLIRQLYPIRTCSFHLSEENISSGKYKECLEYHLQNCKAPCVGWQTDLEYEKDIDSIRKIIQGNLGSILEELQGRMNIAAKNLEYEKAQVLKEKIALLKKYRAKSTVVNPSIKNSDVFTIISDAQTAFVNYLKVHNGAIIQGHSVEIKRKLEEKEQDMLAYAIIDIREKVFSESKVIYTNIPVDLPTNEIVIICPKRGDKKALVDLSVKNANYFRLDRLKNQRITDPEKHSSRILETIKHDLRLSELPEHIECFDNSNFQGKEAVAACVVFRNARPSKKEYRNFIIKSVDGPDDYASMEEVVFRRYRRMLEEKNSLPQLIIIDGGKGQLSSALKSLEKLNLRGQIAVVGVAKRLEEIYFPDDPLPLYLDKRSESLKTIQHLRNEAHRFGISHHRKRRSNHAISSELTKIKGIGPKTQEVLMMNFKSIKRLKDASFHEIENIIGTKKAKIIWSYFHGS